MPIRRVKCGFIRLPIHLSCDANMTDVSYIGGMPRELQGALFQIFSEAQQVLREDLVTTSWVFLLIT